MKLALSLVVLVLAVASCGGGDGADATKNGTPEQNPIALGSCTLGGDDYTSVTIEVTKASEDAAYEVSAKVRLLQRRGGAPEPHEVSFVVEPNASRAYVRPGMEQGSTSYKGCKVELLEATRL